MLELPADKLLQDSVKLRTKEAELVTTCIFTDWKAAGIYIEISDPVPGIHQGPAIPGKWDMLVTNEHTVIQPKPAHIAGRTSGFSPCIFTLAQLNSPGWAQHSHHLCHNNTQAVIKC